MDEERQAPLMVSMTDDGCFDGTVHGISDGSGDGFLEYH